MVDDDIFPGHASNAAMEEYTSLPQHKDEGGRRKRMNLDDKDIINLLEVLNKY